MDKVRFGIIGAGNQGSHYAGLFQQGLVKNGVLTAVADINPQKLTILSEKFPEMGFATFDSAEAMMDSGLCDAASARCFFNIKKRRKRYRVCDSGRRRRHTEKGW